MRKCLYNLVLGLFVICYLPRLLWTCSAQKNYRRLIMQRLGLSYPHFEAKIGESVIWIHAASLGETKATASLVKKLKAVYPKAKFVFSTTTETGYNEAKRLIPEMEEYFFLPFDFSWTINRLNKRLKPSLLILVEGEFWFNLVQSVETAVLVNGRMSKLSCKRFKRFSFLFNPMFKHFKLINVQNSNYKQAFLDLGVDPNIIHVTGNLKFDQIIDTVNEKLLSKELGFKAKDYILTIGSTHPTEEESLLKSIMPLLEKFVELKIVIAPRHPDRFNEVAKLMDQLDLPYFRYTARDGKAGDERVILMDAIGVLNACYKFSKLAIVGGSFVTHIGGHNIFEPVAQGIPVLFGPYMFGQKELATLILEAGCGKQVIIDQLQCVIATLINDPSNGMGEAGLKLREEVYGSVDRTLYLIQNLLSSHLNI
jgi:3-deoxy-D-manno-octulosonic-acid transferase